VARAVARAWLMKALPCVPADWVDAFEDDHRTSVAVLRDALDLLGHLQLHVRQLALGPVEVSPPDVVLEDGEAVL
jgi:hypothetical protein